MKKVVGSIAIAALVVFSLRAQDIAKGPFIGVDGGAILQQKADFRTSAGPSQIATFNPGVRGDLDLGYNFCQSFAVAFEPGFMWDRIHDLGGNPLSKYDQSIDLYSVPLLANFIFRVPTHCSLVPYLGIGGGGNVSVFDFYDKGSQFNETDIEPAAQGELGLEYNVTPNLSLGLAYKFMATLSQRYFVHDIDDHVTIDGVYIHGVFATFSLNF